MASPDHYERKRQVVITLPPTLIKWLTEYGDGVLSIGVLEAVRQLTDVDALYPDYIKHYHPRIPRVERSHAERLQSANRLASWADTRERHPALPERVLERYTLPEPPSESSPLVSAAPAPETIEPPPQWEPGIPTPGIPPLTPEEIAAHEAEDQRLLAEWQASRRAEQERAERLPRETNSTPTGPAQGFQAYEPVFDDVSPPSTTTAEAPSQSAETLLAICADCFIPLEWTSPPPETCPHCGGSKVSGPNPEGEARLSTAAPASTEDADMKPADLPSEPSF